MDNVVYTGNVHFTNTSTDTEDVISQKWYLDDIFVTDTIDADINIDTPGIHKVKLCLLGICGIPICTEKDVKVISPSLPRIDKSTANLDLIADENFNFDFDNIPGYGVGTMHWSIQNAPATITMNENTGVMVGVMPNVGQQTIQVTLTDSIGGTDSLLFTINVSAPSLDNVVPDFTVNGIEELPLIPTITLPEGQEGIPYFYTLSAVGGYGKIVWTVTGLPNGLSANSVMGWISGTPTETGTFQVQITGVDVLNNTLDSQYNLVIT